MSQTTTANASGGWDTTTEVCNNTAAATEFIYWSWPRAKDGSGKIGARKYHPTGPDPGLDTPPPAAVGTAVAAGACAPKTTDSYPSTGKKPFSVYVRVFEKDSGAWVAKKIIAHDIHMMASACIFDLDPPTTLVVAKLPIPFPADLGDLTPGPLSFSIKRVNAPKGWKVAFVSPRLGKKFDLRSNQKNFEGIVVLSLPHNAFLPEGPVVARTVETTWSVKPTSAIKKLVPYERTIKSVFLHDTAKPTIDLAVNQQVASTTIIVHARDDGGIHALPILTIAGTMGQEFRVAPLANVKRVDPEPAIGATEVEYLVELPTGSAKGKMITARIEDQCGNSAEVSREVE